MLSLIKNSDAMIFTGGQVPSEAIVMLLKQLAIPIIAADSGLDTLDKYQLHVTEAVGDFDSLANLTLLNSISDEHLHVFKQDKDDSDTALALILAKQKGFEKVILVGGGGLRSDHFLANLSLMQSSVAPAYWITAYELIIIIHNHLDINVNEGQTLSFYGLSSPIKTESTGLKWPLNSVNWLNNPVSLSNCANSNNIVVSIEGGCLMMLMPYTVNGDKIEWV